MIWLEKPFDRDWETRTYAWINGQVQNEYLMNIEIEQMDKQALGLEVTVWNGKDQ